MQTIEIMQVSIETLKELINAIHDADLEGVQYLTQGIDLNIKLPTEDQQTLLHEACRLGRLNIARWLLENEASANMYNSSGLTPLYKAVQCGSREIVELLLLHGARETINAQGSLGGKTSLYIAVCLGNREIINLLLDNGAREGVNVRNASGATLLHAAANTCNPNIVKFFISEGDKVLINTRDDYGRTPLYKAITGRAHDIGQRKAAGSVETIGLLVSNGAEIEVTNTLLTNFRDASLVLGKALAHFPFLIHRVNFNLCETNAIHPSTFFMELQRELLNELKVLYNDFATQNQSDADNILLTKLFNVAYGTIYSKYNASSTSGVQDIGSEQTSTIRDLLGLQPYVKNNETHVALTTGLFSCAESSFEQKIISPVSGDYTVPSLRALCAKKLLTLATEASHHHIEEEAAIIGEAIPNGDL